MNAEPVEFENKTEVESKQKLVKMFYIHKCEGEEGLKGLSEDESEETSKNGISVEESSLIGMPARNFNSELNFLTHKSENSNNEEGSQSGSKVSKLSKNSRGEDRNYNTGRWTDEEHKKFLEAILIYGNEWKSVQKYISSRSSTQARSHAQKFFLRLKKNFKFSDEVVDPTLNIQDEKERKGKIFFIFLIFLIFFSHGEFKIRLHYQILH